MLLGLLVTGVIAVRSLSSGKPGCVQLAVPAYVAPDSADWDVLSAVEPPPGYVVLNPASGPGATEVAGYRRRAETVRAAGVTPLGYVATGYGRRPVAEVLAEIDRWRQWYGVVDVFLDEVPSGAAESAPTARYADAIRSFDGQVVLNPGVVPDPVYLELADVVVTFEGTAAEYAEAAPDPFAGSARRWHLVHSAPGDVAPIVAAAREGGASFLYVTEQGMPNPWGTVTASVGEQARAGCA